MACLRCCSESGTVDMRKTLLSSHIQLILLIRARHAGIAPSSQPARHPRLRQPVRRSPAGASDAVGALASDQSAGKLLRHAAVLPQPAAVEADSGWRAADPLSGGDSA